MDEIELELKLDEFTAINNTSLSSVIKDLIDTDSETNYMIGVCLCIYSALAASINNVVQVLVSREDMKKSVSKSHFVTSTGKLFKK